MKKRYFTSLFMGLMALGAAAQTQFTVLEDMTSKIANANFKTGTPVANTVRTYDYDMEDDGAANGGVGLYGQQPVEGWTAANLTTNIKVMQTPQDPAREDGTNSRAGGIFAYTTDQVIGLGGNYYPNVDGGDTQGLGIVAVWTANIEYSQHISLPAGDYLLIAKQCNVAGDGKVSRNNFGFKVDDETYFHSKTLSFPVTGVLEGEGKDIWVEDTVVFRLESAVEGDIILGYASTNNGSGLMPHLFIDNVRLLKVDPSGIDHQQVAEAKAELKALIDEGKRLGADTSASEAVYNNANATLAQVQAAIEKQKALNDDAITDLSEFFIMNPHFSMDDPIEDGICTYDYDMEKNGVTHYGMQPVKSWIASNPSQNQVVGNEEIQGRACGVLETGTTAWIGGKQFTPPATLSDGSTGKLLGFVTCWSKTTQYTQHVTLPAGSYTLSISYYNAGGANEVAKNLIGFIADDGTEYLGSTKTFPVGQWGKEVINFTLDAETDGRFSLGYTATNTASGNMPHFFLDGISLFYEGELQFDPSLFALKATVTDAENYEAEKFNADLAADFEDAITEARTLISQQSDDVEANKAAQEKITAMIQEVQASIAAYKRLEDFYNKDLNNAQQKYTNLPELHEQLVNLDDEVSEALNDCTWDNAKIDEVIASLKTTVQAAVQAAWDEALAAGEPLDEDLDISPLFDTLGVTYSTATAQGSNVPDKQWNYGSASNFKTQFGTAEVWSQSPFTVSQTLTGMPAGTYTVSVKAFYRTADNETNYSNYDPSNELAFVFAGHNRKALTNVVEIGTTEEGIPGFTDAGGIYVPNSQEAAHNVFEDEAYTEALLVSTKTALAEQGDLTFGITADEMESNSWVVWYTFEIAYNALDANVLSDELQALIDEAEEANSSYEAGRVLATGEALEAAIGEGQAALDNVNIDEMQNAITQLKAALAEKDRSYELINKFDELVVAYGELYNNLDFTSSDTELIRIIEDKAEDDFESNEEIEQLIERLPAAYFNYVVGRDDLADATEEEPIDLTDILMNPDFSAGNSKYWTIKADEGSADGKIGQNQGYQGASYENGDVVISQFIEAWRRSTAEDEELVTLDNGTISQTLLGVLPKGYYRLEMDGYATNQAGVPEEGITGVSLYSEVAGGIMTTPIGISEASGKPEHFTLDFYSDGVSVATVGLLVKDTNASWVAADNFKLGFIGTQQPVGVSSIEAQTEQAATVYTISGTRVSNLRKGINIVLSNGKAQKVLVK